MPMLMQSVPEVRSGLVHEIRHDILIFGPLLKHPFVKPGPMPPHKGEKALFRHGLGLYSSKIIEADVHAKAFHKTMIIYQP